MTRASIWRAAGGALVALACFADGARAGALAVFTPKVIVHAPTPHVQVNSYSPGVTQVTTSGRGIAGTGLRNGTPATFELDPTSGTVQFGKGTAGQAPPAGANNVTGTYRTGRGGGHRW
jgi:hypothetical protein